MAEIKQVLIADFDKGGRQGTEIVFWGMDNVKVLTASTKEEALSIIDTEQKLDLVIVDPYTDIRFERPIDKNEGSFGVMTSAISRGIKILIITVAPDSVERRLEDLDMQDSSCGMIKKGAGYDPMRDEILKALES